MRGCVVFVERDLRPRTEKNESKSFRSDETNVHATLARYSEKRSGRFDLWNTCSEMKRSRVCV